MMNLDPWFKFTFNTVFFFFFCTAMFILNSTVNFNNTDCNVFI